MLTQTGGRPNTRCRTVLTEDILSLTKRYSLSRRFFGTGTVLKVDRYQMYVYLLYLTSIGTQITSEGDLFYCYKKYNQISSRVSFVLLG